ncbi:MAG: UDP-N-acetylmuramate--L-alanine ligase [Terriglobales bacterium]
MMHFSQARRVHFVGIGGIGMSGIAEVLLTLGWPVSGSDLKPSPVTDRLARLGARIYFGHAAQNADGAEVVVVSSAVAADNPEVLAARARQAPVIPRAEMLAELMRLKFGIAVAGMHGKTTTTSMIAHVLAAGGLDPTVVVGGRVDALGSNARLGKSDYLVAEADESDRSFLSLAPILSVITNLDREHLDCYRDLADIQSAFVAFAQRVPFYGAVLIGGDQEAAQAIVPRIQRRVLTYGAEAENDLQVRDLACGAWKVEFALAATPAAAAFFQAAAQQPCPQQLGRFQLKLPGRHNALNAAAAVAAGLLLGCELETIRTAVAGFGGVDRRFQRKGMAGGVTVVDDYGHHPTEIAATLAAARCCGFGRIVMIFQPHRYTRTQKLHQEFVSALAGADRVILLDIYPASEPPIPGVTAAGLAADLQTAGAAAEYAPSAAAAVARAVELTSPGDLILTQGAGNVSALADKLLTALKLRPALAAQAARRS